MPPVELMVLLQLELVPVVDCLSDQESKLLVMRVSVSFSAASSLLYRECF